MNTSNIAEKLNGILRVVIGLSFFFGSGFMTLVVYSIATRGLLTISSNRKTLIEAINNEPEILFILLFLLAILIASIFSFISGVFSLGIRKESINKKLKWDLYFWISFVCISIPTILGFIYAIFNY